MSKRITVFILSVSQKKNKSETKKEEQKPEFFLSNGKMGF